MFTSKVEKTCEFCNNKYYVHPWKEYRKYCSATCAAQANISTHSGNKSNFWTGGAVTKKCATCDSEYITVASRKNSKYCSVKCSNVGREKKVDIICIYCGKTFTIQKSRSHHNFCSFSCRWKNITGSGNPNWIGGKSFDPYPSVFNEPFKRMIRERDNYACAICKRKGNVVHHINYVKNDTVPENCITVCRSCHGKTNINRSYWIEYFQNYQP